ncbi:hypothetical protein [Haloquadratum walsbyi]|uniref:Uncharacterized protein n=1 Tax=Haloquadratum walsbyi J07HQW2 TaxID=1238425 RepID=U1NE86_9EURY|nr:hypothetical protein [Haloquadratum walsbyi]ERG95320.1 MAG: hypothetical protein J07HQW2_01774 [Haloquadratum walsbyi J07HQW2]
MSETLITLTHEAGLSLRLAMVNIRVNIDQEPPSYQASIPFSAAKWFPSGPYGLYNNVNDGVWSVGEQGNFESLGRTVLSHYQVAP